MTKWGLNTDAAEFVDNYHTDGKNFGTYISMGDMDFFFGEINGRTRQLNILKVTDLHSCMFQKLVFQISVHNQHVPLVHLDVVIILYKPILRQA